MKHQLRRILPRHIADWHGKFLIEGDNAEPWRDCRVMDISSAGVGIELANTTSEEVDGHTIILAIHLRGEVKHSQPAKDDRLRVGAEFLDLTDEERAYLASLQELQAHW
jgi:hypothetical protein